MTYGFFKNFVWQKWKKYFYLQWTWNKFCFRIFISSRYKFTWRHLFYGNHNVNIKKAKWKRHFTKSIPDLIFDLQEGNNIFARPNWFISNHAFVKYDAKFLHDSEKKGFHKRPGITFYDTVKLFKPLITKFTFLLQALN